MVNVTRSSHPSSILSDMLKLFILISRDLNAQSADLFLQVKRISKSIISYILELNLIGVEFAKKNSDT